LSSKTRSGFRYRYLPWCDKSKRDVRYWLQIWAKILKRITSSLVQLSCNKSWFNLHLPQASICLKLDSKSRSTLWMKVVLVWTPRRICRWLCVSVLSHWSFCVVLL
jgi:hypothetical protein